MSKHGAISFRNKCPENNWPKPVKITWQKTSVGWACCYEQDTVNASDKKFDGIRL
jgi:hypothetical protein